MKTEVIEARLEHCKALAERMDQAGKELIRKYWCVDPLEGLTDAFKKSPLCWAILVNDEVAGMFGCTDEGNAWLTTAPAIERVKLRFIRQSGPYIEKMLERYGSLVSYAHKDNHALLAWLKWAGFEAAGTMGDFEICVCRSPR